MQGQEDEQGSLLTLSGLLDFGALGYLLWMDWLRFV